MSVHAITLPLDDRAERRRLEVAPAGPFKTCALLLWGARPGSLIHQLTIIGTGLFVGALPAVMFESDVGFEYFEQALIPSQHHGHPAVDTKNIGKFFRLDGPVAGVGNIITVDIEGQVDRAVLLGRMLPVALPAPEPGVPGAFRGEGVEEPGVMRERMAGQQQ